MRSAQVSNPNGTLEIIEKDIQSLVRVKYVSKYKHVAYVMVIPLLKKVYSHIKYPRVPGHEITGLIDTMGKDVIGWKNGQRVGAGWHGGHCGRCESCRRGDFVTCSYAQIPRISYVIICCERSKYKSAMLR